MTDSNATAPAGAVPASRIPLFLVQGSLQRAAAQARAKTSLRAALDMVPDNIPLRDAIRKAADDSYIAQWFSSAFDRYAVGSAS